MCSSRGEVRPGPASDAESFARQDRDFVAVVDGAFAVAAACSGPHLLCRPGCTQCCYGVFAIGPADVRRLEQGLQRLSEDDPDRANRVRQRAAASWDRLVSAFPGDPITGRLWMEPNSGSITPEPIAPFENFGNDEPCPVLDPASGTCDLYAFRPHTCRVFGPPLATPDGYGVCELCYRNASPETIAAAALPEAAEATPEAVDQAAVAEGTPPGLTIVSHLLRTRAGISP
jgi:Fe-S-cluster containining protein